MRYYVFLILIFFSSGAFSQNVKAEVDTAKIRIGEQFTYKLFVNDTANVILPNLSDLKGLEKVDSTKIDTIKNSLIRKFILTGFDSGSFYIPQQQVFIRNRVFLTDSILIEVATIAIDTTKVKMFDIKNIKEEPIIFDDYKHYVFWGLLILLLIAASIYFYIKRKKPLEEKELIPEMTPLEEALNLLSELDKKLLWQNNDVKKYYSELTEIVRGYIEKELHISALEQTTDELMDVLKAFQESKSIETTQSIINKLNALLREADLVKFAKSKPLANEIEEDRKDAEEILTHLKAKKSEENKADELE